MPVFLHFMNDNSQMKWLISTCKLFFSSLLDFVFRFLG